MRHHPDCDGYRMHSASVVADGHGMWHAECPLPECGFRAPAIGMFGKDHARVSHGGHQECAGECHAWYVDDAAAN